MHVAGLCSNVISCEREIRSPGFDIDRPIRFILGMIHP